MKKPLIYNSSGLLFCNQGYVKSSVERASSFGYLTLLSAMGLALNACGNSANIVALEAKGAGSDTPAVSFGKGEDTGVSAADFYTKQNQPFFDITGPINSQFEVTLKGTNESIAQGTIGDQGKTSLQSIKVFTPDGEYVLTVTSDKGSGKEEDITITVDTSAKKLVIDNKIPPNFTLFQKDLYVNAEEKKSIALAGEGIEANASISFFVSKNSGEEQTFKISDSNRSFITSGAFITGLTSAYDKFYEWSVASIDIESLGLAHGDTLSIRAEQTDIAGNVSPSSDIVDLTVDFEAPMLAAAIKPVGVTFDSDVITFEFDEDIQGTIGTNDFSIIGTQKGGQGIGLNSNKPVSINGKTVTLHLLNEWKADTAITSIIFTGTSLTDIAGNKVGGFTAGSADVDVMVGAGGTGTGTEAPVDLKIDVKVENGTIVVMGEDDPATLAIMEDEFIFVTNDNTPEIILTGEKLNNSRAKLYIGAKPLDAQDVLIGQGDVVIGNTVSFEWGDTQVIMRDKLEDGTYKLFFVTSNQAAVDGETSEYTLIVDTKGPGVVADSSGFIRTGVTSFQVNLNEDAYYGSQKGKFLGDILNNIRFIGDDGNEILLSAGEAIANVVFTGEDTTNQTFTGFTFELSGTTAGGGILQALATQEAVRFSLKKDTIEDRLGNSNDDLIGSSAFNDFKPPKGEIKGFGTNQLLIYFPQGATLASPPLTEADFAGRIVDSNGQVYTLNGAPVFDETTGVLTLTTNEFVVGNEIDITIPLGKFKSYGLTWENANIEHVVEADLRTPKAPIIDLRAADDSGINSDDNITKQSKPHIDFIVGANDKAGTLEITITGMSSHGKFYEKTIRKEVAKGEVYTLDSITFEEGRYKISAVIVDKFGQRSNEGVLSGPSTFSGYTLSGDDAALFEISDAGVLRLLNSATGAGGNYDVTVNYRDGTGDLISQDVDVNIVAMVGAGGANAAPVFDVALSDTVRVVSGDTIVGTFSATDSDAADTLIYSLEGYDADKFTIDANTGEVTFTIAPDVMVPESAGKNNDYKITIVATDGKEETFHDVTVEVGSLTSSNVAPTFGATTAMDVMEGERFVGLFSGMDDDSDKLYYSIEGKDSHLFEITEGGVLRFRDASKDGDYSFRVVVSDGTDAIASSSETVMVIAAPAVDAPAFDAGLMISGSFDQGMIGDVVGTFAATGVGVIMYEILGVDAASFMIDTSTGAVLFAADISYVPVTRSAADDNDYYFTVRAFDGSGVDAFHDLKITITGINQAPVFDGLPADIMVLGGNNKVVDLKGVDADGDELTFAFGGADADKFEIIGDVLRLKPGVDFEPMATNVYDIELSVSDGKTSTTQAIMVEIEENNTIGNTRPEFLVNTPSVLYTHEKIISRFGASDKDGDSLTWTLEGLDAGNFAITATGVLSFNVKPDFETPLDDDGNNVYELVIKASDGMSSIFHDLIVHVTDTPEVSTTAPWMDSFDVVEGKRFVGTFKLDDSGSDSEYVLDKQAPNLISVVPVFSALGSQKLVVTFNEEINKAGVNYNQFRLAITTGNPPGFDGDMAPDFDTSRAPELVGGNRLELFLTDDFGGDTFHLYYTAPVSGGSIQDIAGNLLDSFDAQGKILAMPLIDHTKWSDNGTSALLTDDIVTFTFNGNIQWIDTLVNILTAGASKITWTDNADPLMVVNEVVQATYDVVLLDNVITISFMGVAFPTSDDIEFSFGKRILSLDIPGVSGEAGVNDEIKVSVDSKSPDKPTLEVSTNTLQYSDLATDKYINIQEQGGTGFKIAGTSPDNTADLNVRTVGGTDIEDVVADTPATWEYVVMDSTLLTTLVDGDTLDVDVYLTDVHDNPSDSSDEQLMLEVDLLKPDLVAMDARALEGSDLIFIEVDDELLQNDIESSAFTVTIGGAEQVIDTVSIRGNLLKIDLDNAVIFDTGDVVLIDYNQSVAADMLVYDKAGNPLDDFAGKMATVTNAPLITSIMIEDVAGGLKKVLLTFNRNVESHGDPLKEADIIIEGFSNFTGVPTITGDMLEVTLDAAEVVRLKALENAELTLTDDTVTLVGETDGNFAQKITFDLQPPTGVEVDLQPNSDTGVLDTDNITMQWMDTEFMLMDPNGDVVEAKVRIENAEGTFLMDLTVDASLEFMYTFAAPTDTIGKVYRLHVFEAKDGFGNALTVPQPALEVRIDTSVAFQAMDAIDFGGTPTANVHYIIPNNPATDSEITVRLRYQKEFGLVGDLSFFYRYTVADIAPASWTEIGDFKEVFQGETTFMSGVEASGEHYVEFDIVSATMFENTYLDGLDRETYFQFRISDEAGNVADIDAEAELAADLDLSVSLSTGHVSDTGLSSKDFITNGLNNGADYFIKYHFSGASVSWGSVDAIKIRAKRYDLTTGDLATDYFYDQDISGAELTNITAEKSARVDYMGADDYFHAEYEFGFVNTLFGATPESARPTQTVVVDRKAPELSEAVLVGNLVVGGGYTVNNVFLFTSTQSSDFVLAGTKYLDKTGEHDYLDLRDPVGARAQVEVSSGGTTLFANKVGKSTSITGGLYIGFSTLNLSDGDTITIKISSLNYQLINPEPFIGDTAGNGLNGTFSFTVDSAKILGTTGSLTGTGMGNNRFATTTTRNDNIITGTWTAGTPSIDSDVDGISLSVIGVEPLSDGSGDLW